MHQTPGEERTSTEPYRDPEVEHIEKRAALVRRVNGIVWFLFAVLEVIIGMRVVLKLIGANPANSFTDLIYDLSYPFLVPFSGIVDDLQAGDGVLEISSLIAMLVYLFAAWGITRLLELIMMPTEAERH
jgi:uncharacterized protein YggT (Ycf19 family)